MESPRRSPSCLNPGVHRRHRRYRRLLYFAICRPSCYIESRPVTAKAAPTQARKIDALSSTKGLIELLPNVDCQAFVVVDSRGRIRFASEAYDHGEDQLKRILVNRAKLQPEVESFIGGMLSRSPDGDPAAATFCLLRNNHVLRVVRLTGAEGSIFVLTTEPDRNGDSLVRAVRRFQLTRRETEVLALILDGFSAREIAEMLEISEHTVQGYFKRLLSKTKARNRVSMVASILEWNSLARIPLRTGRARAQGMR